MSESIRDGLRQVVREHTIRRATKIAPDEWSLWGCWGCEWEGDSSGHAEHVGDMVLAYLAAQATEAGVAEVLAERAYMVSAGKCGHPAVPWADSSEFTRSMWINVATEVAAALAPLLAARAETRTVSAEQVEAAAEARGARGNLVSFLAALGIEVRDAD